LHARGDRPHQYIRGLAPRSFFRCPGNRFP
jgi:hypothetical protein